MRSTLEIAPKPAADDRSPARWLRIYCRFASLQRAAMRPPMPMAISASALRRLASASPLRDAAASVAALVGRAHENFGQQRQRDEHDGADQRRQADQRMECEADGEIERHPGQIEQCDRAEAGQKRADGIEIAQRLQCRRRGRRPSKAFAPALVDAAAQGLVERAADTHENAAADQIENARGGEQAAARTSRPTSVGTLRLGSTRS